MLAARRVNLFAIADLRRAGPILSADRNEGRAFRARDLFSAGAVDLMQLGPPVANGARRARAL